MATVVSNTYEDDILFVGVYNDPDEYMLWQSSPSEGEIHFEWDSQVNGSYDNIQECSIDKDGIHVVLKNKKMVHFYFVDCSTKQWHLFVKGLKKTYTNLPDVLDIYD